MDSVCLKSDHINYYSGSQVDRMSEKRNDKEWIKEKMSSLAACFVIFVDMKPLGICIKNYNVEKIPGSDAISTEKINYSSLSTDMKYTLCQFKYSDIQELIPDPVMINCPEPDSNLPIILIGKEIRHNYLNSETVAGKGIKQDDENQREKCWFAVDMSELKDMADKLKEKEANSNFLSPRPDLLCLNSSEAAIVAQARSILCWLERYKFCPTCGRETFIQDAGYKRTCKDAQCLSNQGIHNTSYPRTDPVAITLVISPDKKHALLGRKERFPQGMYSCLAGFMEPGESIEEAARREVKEESGVVVGRVMYHSSQPWPFPSVLMIGCIGWASTDKITICKEELEDVQWFSREEVAKAVLNQSTVLFVPPPQTIAHQLMKFWAQDFKLDSTL